VGFASQRAGRQWGLLRNAQDDRVRQVVLPILATATCYESQTIVGINSNSLCISDAEKPPGGVLG